MELVANASRQPGRGSGSTGFGNLQGSSCVRRDELLNRLKRVDFVHVFIRAQPENSGEAERVTALVPLGFLNPIEGHFNHSLRFDQADSAVREFLNGMIGKPLSHFR